MLGSSASVDTLLVDKFTRRTFPIHPFMCMAYSEKASLNFSANARFRVRVAVRSSTHSIAWLGQYFEHAGSPPHMSHLNTLCVTSSHIALPNGQAWTHILQPMHLASSRFTQPVAGSRVNACGVQTVMQGASRQF